jgi:hypothetical protein
MNLSEVVNVGSVVLMAILGVAVTVTTVAKENLSKKWEGITKI